MRRFHNLPWDQKAAVAIATTRRSVLRQHGRAPKQAAAIGLEAIQALAATCDDVFSTQAGMNRGLAAPPIRRYGLADPEPVPDESGPVNPIL